MENQNKFLSKLPLIIAAISDKKAKLLLKKAQVREARHTTTKADEEPLKQLEFEWALLETEINGLESAANVMRNNLVTRQCLEVNSVNEMKVVNELRLGIGAGAGPGMPLFTGKIHVPEDLPVETVRGIQAAEEACEIF